jgi:hypothetical protein
MLTARPIVVLLICTQLANAKWQLPPRKRQSLCCATVRQNQLFTCKDVTVGNKRTCVWKTVPQAMAGTRQPKVQCVECPFSSWGNWTLQLSRADGEQYTLTRYDWVILVPQMSHLQPNVFFQQDGARPYWCLTVRESEQADWLGGTDQSLGPLTHPK